VANINEMPKTGEAQFLCTSSNTNGERDGTLQQAFCEDACTLALGR